MYNDSKYKLIVDDDTGMLVCPECGTSLGIEYFVPRSE